MWLNYDPGTGALPLPPLEIPRSSVPPLKMQTGNTQSVSVWVTLNISHKIQTSTHKKSTRLTFDPGRQIHLYHLPHNKLLNTHQSHVTFSGYILAIKAAKSASTHTAD